MKIRLLFFRIFTIITILFTASFVNATTFTSTLAGGDWSLPSTWVDGVVPKVTDDVVISIGSIVNLNTNVSAYSVTISGTLALPFHSNYTINTELIVVTSSGLISFDHSTLNLPATVSLYLQNGQNSLGGDCNNNDQIYVGNQVYGICQGIGNSGAYLFSTIENAGGINIVTAGAIGSSQIICSGFTPSTLTSTILGTGSGIVTYEWQMDSTGSYVTIAAATAAIYSPPSLITTTSYKRRTVSVIGGKTFYSVYTNPVTIEVNALPSAPVLGIVTQPDCNTVIGSVVLNGLPATGNWTLSRTGTSSAILTGSGTSVFIPSLAPGSYSFTLTNTSGCISSSVNLLINAVITSVWNGSSWSTGVPPDSNQAIVFNGDYSSFGDVAGCSCQVNSGVNVFFNSPDNLTIKNQVVVLGTGTLTFDYDHTLGANPINSASLVQLNNVATNTNSGNIIFKRSTNTIVTSSDYTYWSSPVSLQTLHNLSPNTLVSMFYSFDGIWQDWKLEATTNTMNAGVGYIVGGPKLGIPPALYPATFIGVPTNGVISLPDIVANSSYLLGNPYPSAIDADAFLQENKSVLGGTLYFWTHNTAIQDRNLILSTAGSGAYAYTSNDYASYNGTGGVGATDTSVNTSSSFSSGGNKNIPSGKIAACQGFFASSLVSPTTTAIVFNNDIRVVGTSGNNSQFFKSSNTKKNTVISIEKDRIWLNLSNKKGAFKQTLVGYITDATNDYDDRFDGESFDGNEFVDFYSILQDKNLTIQGRALPFYESDIVPLGFRTTIEGDFSINIEQVDGLFINHDVFIEDKLTKTIFNLKSGNYVFSTIAGIFNDRFVLRYSNNNSAKTTLLIDNFDRTTSKVLVSAKNKQVKVNSFSEVIEKVSIFDLLGRQIYQKINVNNNELLIANLDSIHQTLVVKTILQNGETVTDKIIF